MFLPVGRVILVDNLAIHNDFVSEASLIMIIIMHIYHVFIVSLSTHTIPVNLNAIFYTYVGDSPINAVYMKYYMKHTHAHKKVNTMS